ncbi:MAG: ABC transporter permease [Acidobacteria bacterium]|nr:ABC transporter permease [Acidobacteriota bacterium]MBI3424306.1 ABC transporter permease [Acidobacteriota bacterium]
MEFSETIKLALDAIWANKLRSTLTLLGMIIGVTAVVLVVSLIQGFNRYVDEKIAGIGAKSFSIRRFGFDDWKSTDSIANAQRRNKEITFDDFDYIQTRATLIDKLGAKALGSPSILKYHNESAENVGVDGATANCVDIENLDIADGRYFTDTEDKAGMPVILLGWDVAAKLFPSGNAVGNEISVNGLPYRVVGVAAAKGTIFGMPQDVFATVPLRTYIKNYGPAVRQRSFYMLATAKDDNHFADAVEEARALMRVRRELKFNEKDNFGINTPDAVMGIRDRLLGPIFIAATAVPAIALVVGGIVIMNIMLVSVTERTREIGIRKSLGARQTDILKQFLIEAVMLSAIGGTVGVLIAWAIGRILTAFVFQTYLSIAAVIVAVVVSGVIGILSGILPARKAALLDPIVALRAE